MRYNSRTVRFDLALRFRTGYTRSYPLSTGSLKTAKAQAIRIWKEHAAALVSMFLIDFRQGKVALSLPEELPNPRPRIEVVTDRQTGFYVAAVEGHHIQLLQGPFPTKKAAESAARRVKPLPNPRRHRMGRLIEIRYERDHGRHKGFYKHEFTTPVDVFANDETIFAKGAR